MAAYQKPDVLKGPAWLAAAMPKVAVLVLLAGMAMIDLTQVTHPGLSTLPTVAATAALIWFARPGEAMTRLLSLQPMVYIGKLSYSLYLWHFPVFAFGRLSCVDAPNAMDMALWVAVTLVCSVAGYHLVERRFRFDLGARAFTGITVTALAVVVVFTAAGRGTDLAVSGRAADLTALYGENDFDNEALRRLSWEPLADLAGLEEIDLWGGAGLSDADAAILTFRDAGAVSVLLLGNSHSKDLFNDLHLNSEAFPGMEFTRFGM